MKNTFAVIAGRLAKVAAWAVSVSRSCFMPRKLKAKKRRVIKVGKSVVAITADSGPVKGVTVRASGPAFIPPVKTDGAGRYSLKSNVPGRYTVSVQGKR